MWYIDVLNNYLTSKTENWPFENKNKIERFCKNIDILFDLGLTETDYPVTVYSKESEEDPEPEMADCFSPLGAKLCLLTYLIKYIDKLSANKLKELQANELLQIVFMAIIIAVKFVSDEEFANNVFFPGSTKIQMVVINKKERDFLAVLEYQTKYDLNELEKIFGNKTYLNTDIINNFKLEINNNFKHMNDEAEREELNQLLAFFSQKNSSFEYSVKSKHSPTMFNKQQKDNSLTEEYEPRRELC